MRKLIILSILLFSKICFAQISSLFPKYYKAEVTLNNGIIKSGYAEPVSSENSSINFKLNLDEKKEKIKLNDISKIHYFDEKEGKQAIVEKLLATNGKNSSEAFLYLIEEGDISVYGQTSVYILKYRYQNFRISHESKDISYFFRYKDEKKATLITMKFEGGIVVPIGMKNFTKKGIKEFFGDKCPKLVTAYENDEIKFKKDVSVFIDYYEKNCK